MDPPWKIMFKQLLISLIIRFASHISNGRIYIYLDNSNITRNFSHSKLLIQNIHTIVRLLINPFQKVILSNILHEYIQNIFKKQKSN